jgi:hypothetical protein
LRTEPRRLSLARAASLLAALLALALPACGESRTVELDAGPIEFDASATDLDAGPPALDAGPGPTDAGPPDAAAPGDAGPILPPTDAGDPFGDAGTLGTPPWVPLDVRVDGSSCATLVACGGDLDGAWDVAGGCVEVPVPMDLMRCPGAAITRGEGRTRGRVFFMDGFSRRTAQWEVEVEFFVPGFCASFVGGCAGIQSAVQMSTPDARCIEDAGDCRCAVRQLQSFDEAGSYTIEGNQIVAETTGKRWDYCIEGDSMRYQDVSETGTREAGIIELGRR